MTTFLPLSSSDQPERGQSAGELTFVRNLWAGRWCGSGRQRMLPVMCFSGSVRIVSNSCLVITR